VRKKKTMKFTIAQNSSGMEWSPTGLLSSRRPARKKGEKIFLMHSFLLLSTKTLHSSQLPPNEFLTNTPELSKYTIDQSATHETERTNALPRGIRLTSKKVSKTFLKLSKNNKIISFFFQIIIYFIGFKIGSKY
jgi:hypothetical protein